jgi:hypothetical protein
LTTASNRGNLRGRGRGRSAGTATTRGRGRSTGTATGRATTNNANARSRGKKRNADASSSGTIAPDATTDGGGAPDARNIRRTAYNTGPGSAYYLLLGDDGNQSEIPDLNATIIAQETVEEIAISQNAPAARIVLDK